MSTRELISNILSGNLTEAKQNYDSTISEKISVRLAEEKLDIAESIYVKDDFGDLTEAEILELAEDLPEEFTPSLEEKYVGFDKLVAKIKAKGGASDPEAVAASIGRKKYGKRRFQKAAAAEKPVTKVK